jgi:hypothetical protein
MKPKHYAWIAAAVLAAEAVFAVVHRAGGWDYRGFTRAHDVVLDPGLAVVWAAAASAALVRWSFPAFFVAMLGAAASLAHGIMFSVSSPHTGAGLPFLAAAVVTAVALKRSLPAWRGRDKPLKHEARPPEWRELRA